jgi:CRP/FNR family cyclic AMP-dependent transcriptional regulator
MKAELIPVVSALTQTELFRGIPLPALERLAALGRRQTFATGAALMRQGDASEALHVILRGRVRVERYQQSRAEPQVLAEFLPGEIVGEMGVLDNAPRSATVVALDETETLGLTAGALAVVFSQYPSAAGAMMRTLTQRLRDADEVVDELLGDAPPAESRRFPSIAQSNREALALQMVSAEFMDRLKAAIRAT